MIAIHAGTIGEAWLETARRILEDGDDALRGPLGLVVYAHSLDFGKKAYGNLVELARLQHEVASGAGVAVGQLVIHAKSAHIYEPELDLMREAVA